MTDTKIKNLVHRCEELREFSRMNDRRYFQKKENADDEIQLGRNALPETRAFYAQA